MIMVFWRNQPVRSRTGLPADWRVPVHNYDMPAGYRFGETSGANIKAFLDAHFSAYKWSRKSIERMDKIIVMFYEDNIVGCIGARALTGECWYVDLLCVHSDWRGVGIAGILNARIAEACMRPDRSCRILFKIDSRPLGADIIPIGRWSYWALAVSALNDNGATMVIPRVYDIECKPSEWIRVGGWWICGTGNTISRFWGLLNYRVFDMEGIYGEGTTRDLVNWLNAEGYDFLSITDMKQHKQLIERLGLIEGNSFWVYAYGWDTSDIIATL